MPLKVRKTGAWSSVIGAPVLAVAPAAPATPIVTARPGALLVTIQRPSSSGRSQITGYRLTVVETGQTLDVDARTLVNAITGLTNGTAYTVTAMAKNVSGFGPPSPPSSPVAPSATAPLYILKWPPPPLTNPTDIYLTTASPKADMDPTKDYRVHLPTGAPILAEVQLIGGRNVVLIGGEISPNPTNNAIVPPNGTNPRGLWTAGMTYAVGDFVTWHPDTGGNGLMGAVSKTAHTATASNGPDTKGNPNWDWKSPGRGLFILGTKGANTPLIQTRTVHVEGVKFSGFLGEVMDIDSSNETDLTVQLQMIRNDAQVIGAYAANHADFVQNWNGPHRYRLDYITAKNLGYQGLFMQPHQFGNSLNVEFALTRANFELTPEAAYGLYNVSPADDSDPLIDQVYVKPNPKDVGVRKNYLWAGSLSAGNSQATYWANVIEGVPPSGDFVPSGVAGYGYVSSGYES